MAELKIVGISKEPTSNDNLIVKLQKKVADVAVPGLPGATKKVSETYYIAVNSNYQGVIGTDVDLPLDKFNVVEREFVTETGDKMMLKWLHLK